MKTVATLAVLALLAYAALATPCTDICNGQCSILNTACEFNVFFGGLCNTQSVICAQSCAAACGCADICAAQCGGGFANCKGDGSDILNIFSCSFNLPFCASTCYAKCNFNLFASIIDLLTNSTADALI